MAVKTPQWLALAMLLSVAVAAIAAKQEEAAKPTDAPVDASIAAKKYKDNYHKEDYHKDNYHKEDYHKGGEYYPKGGEYYPKGGEYYPKGGEYYPKGGEYYPSDEYPGDYHNKDGNYEDYGYGYSHGGYPNYGSHSYSSYPDYGHSSDEYPHDGYGYGHDKGQFLYLPRPSDRTSPAVACPVPSTTPATNWGNCAVKCFGPVVNGVYEFGCFVEGDFAQATLTCPGHTQVVNCDCDCSDNNRLTACVSTNIGGVRKTCLSMCDAGKGQVRALCK